MCDSTFAFGQRGSHVFQCPSRREIARLPTKLSTLLSSAQLHRVYHVALGFEDSFLITWSDKKGYDHIDSLNLPLELREFLYARNPQKQLVRNVPRIRCSLGSYNSSFFAHDGSTYRWMNLPPSLLLALQSRIKDGNWTDRPRLVSLGASDNFVLLTEKNAAIWNLQNYKTMANLLDFSKTQDGGISEIRNIVLHAHRYGSFITQSRNGTLMHENLPPHSIPGLEAMYGPILQDSKEAEWRLPLRRESDMRHSLPRQPSKPPNRAILGREWSEHSQQFTAKAKGVKLSLSLSVSMNGMAAKLMR